MTIEERIAETHRIAAEAKAERDRKEQVRTAVLSKSEWPWLVRTIALFRAPEDVGIGDTLAREIKRFHFDSLATAYKFITGKDCKCPQRQQMLNTLYPYAAA